MNRFEDFRKRFRKGLKAFSDGTAKNDFKILLGGINVRHALRRSAESIVDAVKLCEICEDIADTTIKKLKAGMNIVDIVKMVIGLCVKPKIETPEVCAGAVKLNVFVAHSNVQQLLASIWYEGLPGFRRKNMVLQALEIVRIGILFPFFSVAYIIAPHSLIGQTMRKPFIKFICHSASYFTFLFMLILASQRIETLFFAEDPTARIPTKRGAKPSLVEWIILAWVSGLIWSEIKQLWDVGLEEYVRDMWNVIDFITNSLYVATVALRVVSYYQVQIKEYDTIDNNERKNWDAWDPMLISEGLFSAANIFSSLKLVYIFSVNPHLGPLQVSLSRMVMDIMKFFFLYVLVLFAFSCGLNQLLWYYAEAERQNCPTESPTTNSTDTNACQIWRRFANLFETAQTLFWAVFGLVDLESFDLSGIKIFTRFWGMLMFGTYSVINIVVLLNLLIAMMNHSYQLISERADIEWKFARSKLWISYFEEGGTVPPPFNIVPTPKSLWYVIQWVQRKLCGHSRAAKKEHMRTIRRKVKQASERDFRYQSIMRNLVRRYVTVEQRKAENQGVTEDDVNEIKQDISAFRFELIEILKNSGMNTSTAHSGMGSGTGGKKNRQKERRLMKGFNIGPQPSTTSGPLPPVAEFIASLQQHHEGHHHDLFGSTFSGIFNSTPRKILHHSTVSSSQGSINEAHHHRTLGSFVSSLENRLHMKRTASHKRRWGTLIEAAKAGKVSRLIGRSRSEDSVCNSHCRENNHNHSHSHSNSPASEDNITESPSDSNPSIDQVCNQSSHTEPHGLAAGLSLLKKKRKKFSASRNTSPVVVPPNPVEHAIAVCIGKSNKKVSQVLKRASSVPTRVPEVVQLMQRHEQTQSQQDSVEIPPPTAPTTLTPSTTEESVTNAGQSQIASGISSREPLLYNSSSSNQATGSSQTPEEEYRNNGQGLNKLPGVIPLSGHNCPSGWL
ncbi:hypothetical protein Trydic_g7337 [Trypoxylus dichotomus]